MGLLMRPVSLLEYWKAQIIGRQYLHRSEGGILLIIWMNTVLEMLADRATKNCRPLVRGMLWGRYAHQALVGTFYYYLGPLFTLFLKQYCSSVCNAYPYVKYFIVPHEYKERVRTYL